jgi:hypothetical protein
VFERLFKKKNPPASGVSIVLLQKQLERFSTDRLNTAMQLGWRREHDKQRFFAVSIFDGEAALLKLGSAYFTLRHFDRQLNSNELGKVQLPGWAVHGAHSSVGYRCPGGVPRGELRDGMYRLLGLLCAELITPQTAGLFFPEERCLFENTSDLCERLRSGNSLFLNGSKPQ